MSDSVSSSKPSRAALIRPTSSNRHPGCPETPISAMFQAHDSAPAGLTMTRLDLRMQDLVEDFEGLEHARTGAVEVLISVGYADAARECGPIVPVHFTECPRNIEPAGRDDYDIGGAQVVEAGEGE